VLLARLFVAVTVVTALASAGCTQRVGGEPDVPSSSSGSVGPVDLAVPVEVCPVLASDDPPLTPAPSASASASTDASVVSDAEGTEYTVDAPFMTIERIERGSVEFASGGQWVISLEMTETDGRAFGDWTTDHVGEQAAMVIDGEVLFAPTIQGAITDGRVQVSGNYTQDEAKDILDKITGK
jgi:hypothetical protein